MKKFIVLMVCLAFFMFVLSGINFEKSKVLSDAEIQSVKTLVQENLASDFKGCKIKSLHFLGDKKSRAAFDKADFEDDEKKDELSSPALLKAEVKSKGSDERLKEKKNYEFLWLYAKNKNNEFVLISCNYS